LRSAKTETPVSSRFVYYFIINVPFPYLCLPSTSSILLGNFNVFEEENMMNKKMKLGIASLILAFLLSACGNNTSKSNNKLN
jgi:hypothetical protein